MKTLLDIPNISCDHCERVITKRLRSVRGVSTVRVDIAGKRVEVDHDVTKASVETLQAVLAEEEYPATVVGS